MKKSKMKSRVLAILMSLAVAFTMMPQLWGQSHAEIEKFTITIHWSSMDGVDIDGQKPVVINDVAYNTTFGDALEGKNLTPETVFQKDGYVALDYAADKPLTNFNDWHEFSEGSEFLHKVDKITQNTEIYIPMLKEIRSASATVKAPVCGVDVTIGDVKDDSESMEGEGDPDDIETLVQEPRPEYSFPAGVPYETMPIGASGGIPPLWIDLKDNQMNPFVGSFEGGKRYKYILPVMSKYGYGFSEKTTWLINGEKAILSETAEVVFVSYVISDVEAVHNWDAGKVTKAATTTSTGDMTHTCKSCKATKKVTIPKLVMKTNPLKVKGKTATVKGSTKGKNGKLKKTRTLAVSKVIAFTKKGQGKMTYVKASGNKKITINKTTGKVTVKKGIKKGTYKVKVKVKAAGNTNYKASAVKTVTFKIKVR